MPLDGRGARERHLRLLGRTHPLWIDFGVAYATMTRFGLLVHPVRPINREIEGSACTSCGHWLGGDGGTHRRLGFPCRSCLPRASCRKSGHRPVPLGFRPVVISLYGQRGNRHDLWPVVWERRRLLESHHMGVLVRLIWWYFGPMTLLPLCSQVYAIGARMRPPALLPSLFGHLIYRRVTAVVFFLFDRGYTRTLLWIPEPPPGSPSISPCGDTCPGHCCFLL